MFHFLLSSFAARMKLPLNLAPKSISRLPVKEDIFGFLQSAHGRATPGVEDYTRLST